LATGAVVLLIVLYAVSRGSQGTGNSTTRIYPTPGPLLAVGSVAPDFTLTSVDGRQVSLHQYRGQAVVLELFAPWCPNCQAETSVLKEIQTNYAGKEVQVLNVSASHYGRNYETSGGRDTTPISMDDLEWYQTTFGLNFPSLFDPSLKVGADYGVTAFPTLYIIDASGKVSYVATGVMSQQAIDQQIQQTQGAGN
jgi:peroxiredoxin